VRILMAIVVMMSFQLKADAQESSADLSSSAPPSKNWGKSRDMFVEGTRDPAKVKAFVRDLLGEDRPPATRLPEENSGQSESID